MELFSVEATVGEDGSVLLPAVPFAHGTRLIVTLEEAEPMDREAFEAALRQHYGVAEGGVEAPSPPPTGGS